MTAPSTYYQTAEELAAVKAMAFLFLMSDETAGLDGPLANALFDMVGDNSEAQALADIATYAATQ